MVAALKLQQNRDASHNPKRILPSSRVYRTSIPALCAQFENELMEIRTAQYDRLFPSVTLPPTVSLDIFPDKFVI